MTNCSLTLFKSPKRCIAKHRGDMKYALSSCLTLRLAKTSHNRKRRPTVLSQVSSKVAIQVGHHVIIFTSFMFIISNASYQGLIQKEKVHIDCEKGVQISILTNKITTKWWPNIIIKESKLYIAFIFYFLSIIFTLCCWFDRKNWNWV